MITFLEGIPIGTMTAPAAFILMATLVITDKLVWHKRLDKVEARADRLEQMLFSALGVAETAVKSSEITHDVIAKLPDPASPGGP